MAASRHDCTICMDSFKNPKLISCHHSFCYKCLEDYVQVNLHNGCFNCPICRTSVQLPESGISGFENNFNNDTEKNENFPCEICGPKNVACSRCLDCEENLCQSCCYVHEKSKLSRHHKISDLLSLAPELKGKVRQRVFCDQHPEEEIQLVCQDCNVTICLMCKAVKHDTHPTKALVDAAAEVKMTLDAKLNQCSDKLRFIKSSVERGEELDRSINDAEQEELKTVDGQCSQLHEAIDQEAAKLKDNIKNVYRFLKEQNAVFRSCMEEELKSCSNTKDIAQNLRDQGTDIEIIKRGPAIEQIISAAIAKTDPTPTVRLTSKLFSPATIIADKLIPLIGVLRDYEAKPRDLTRMLADTRHTSRRKQILYHTHLYNGNPNKGKGSTKYTKSGDQLTEA
ncbi:hypothetical protein ACJMK2_003135 [Sinanodonta woodiana]|uniref:Uncharacterized protein n=1 Tax=Sinanodonta woodiana TaxID=1069815 RepID=A0ABD3Y0K3_SINWO